MKIFKKFPKNKKCIVCGKNTDKECVLIPIDGTQEGNIEKAEPIHLDCIELRLNIKGNEGILYKIFDIKEKQ